MKYAIFDMDGTLIDSMPLWEEVAGQYCAANNIKTDVDLNHLFHKMTIPQAAEYFKKEFGLEESVEDILSALQANAYEAYAERVPLKPGVLEALTYFHDAGIPMGVATANERRLVDVVLKRLGLNKYISCIRTCSQVGMTKRQSAAVFESCLQGLGGEKTAEAFVFEDAPHAAESAKRAGFTTVGVFDESYSYELDRLKQASDFFFDSAHSWPQLLQPA